MKRAYAPFVVVPSLTKDSIREGAESAEASVGLRLVSDYLTPLEAVHLNLTLWSWSGERIHSSTTVLDVPAQGQIVVFAPMPVTKLLPSGIQSSDCFFVFKAHSKDGLAASNELYLTPFKGAQIPKSPAN